jgi:putative Holliday junction resolvase
VPTNPPPGRIAGIDYGDKRIGVALTDPEQRFASPADNHNRGDETAETKYFRLLASEERVVRFVVGLPVHLSGRESEKSRAAREFGAWLTKTTGVPVVFFDERFTTSDAERMMAASGAHFTKKQRKARLDKHAAQILLTAYLEAGQPSDEDPPQGLDD